MPIHLQSGDAITASYQLKTSNFEAVARSSYAVDTSAGSINVTLPANPVEGDAILFADARKTWSVHPPVFLRNGNNIEGASANYTNSSQGTFFTAVYLDSTMGWRILESDTKPQNLALPSLSTSSSMVGVPVTVNPGLWTGAATVYIYQWQNSSNNGLTWENIVGETNSTYTPNSTDEGKRVRIGVIASNANGNSSIAYSTPTDIITTSQFPQGAIAFWKMNDVTDSSGNGVTLTNTNTTFVPGKIGNCANFDGTGRLSSNQVNWQLSSGDASLSIWMNLPARNSQKSMVGFYQGGSPAGGFAIDLLTGNNISISNAAAAINSTITWVGDNVWGHFAVVKTGTTVKLYRNGVLVKTVTTSLNYFSKNAFGITFYMGDCRPPGFPGPAEGKVDSFGLWNRALSEAEITALYNNGDGLEPA